MSALYKKHFYHNLIRKYVTVMGAIVDGIDVVRYKTDGTEEQRVRIPVSYSPKEKWIRRITEDPSLNRQPGMTLPRIGFEMTGMMYAPERKVSQNRYFAFVDEDNGNSMHKMYTAVPYDFTFNVYVQTKTQDEMFQVIEQIVPFFQPDYTVEMRGLSSPEIKWDIPITLDALQTSDNYDGEIEDRRMIITTFEFIMKGYLFGPTRKAGVIKHVDLEFRQKDSQVVYDKISIEPYIEGVPLSSIKADDDYGIRIDYE